MKKTIKFFTLLAIIISLTFIPNSGVYASNSVNLTYYAGKGYFKAKSNRSKSKLVIKNKINKKRGYAPSIRRNGYTFTGWYTKKKSGKKYSASTIIKKKLKLYPHWVKRYKINTNYFVPMGLSLTGVDDFQKYYGELTVIRKNIKAHVSPGEYYCKNNKGDSISIFSWYGYNGDYFQIDSLKCKLKNVINIKKTTSLSLFLKKLGVKEYNYNSKTHSIDFICGKCYCNFHNDDDAEYEDVWWTIKMNNKNQIMPSTVVKFELITDWQIW